MSPPSRPVPNHAGALPAAAGRTSGRSSSVDVETQHLARHAGLFRPALADVTLSRDDMGFIAKLVYEHAGIVIREHKEAMTRGRLARRVKALGVEFGRRILRLPAHARARSRCPS
jgi:hypothetical protein